MGTSIFEGIFVMTKNKVSFDVKDWSEIAEVKYWEDWRFV